VRREAFLHDEGLVHIEEGADRREIKGNGLPRWAKPTRDSPQAIRAPVASLA
jgi:hypothetical protein